jgi:hypothetical protein
MTRTCGSCQLCCKLLPMVGGYKQHMKSLHAAEAMMYDPRIANAMINLVFGSQDGMTIGEVRTKARALIRSLPPSTE